MKPHIKSQIISFWSETWNSLPYNKLKNNGAEICKKNFNNFFSRIDEIKFTRIRLGHTRFTHSYHFTGDQFPICAQCNCPYTIRHILRLCPRFRNERKKHFGKFTLSPKSLQEILDRKNSYQNKAVINFIKDINFFKEI